MTETHPEESPSALGAEPQAASCGSHRTRAGEGELAVRIPLVYLYLKGEKTPMQN